MADNIIYKGAKLTGKKARIIVVDELTSPPDTSKMIFVFGSNLAGRHGAGAARYAREQRGAEMGVGVGRTGACWALPTKDRNIQTLSLETIRWHVERFMDYARVNLPEAPFTEDLTFQVTCVGCGLAGFDHAEIAPMFLDAPSNCYFDTAWAEWLPGKKFWGTF